MTPGRRAAQAARGRLPAVVHPLLVAALATASLGAGPTAPPGGAPTASEALQLGERIYREGVLPSGQPLRAVRMGTEVSGAQAACVLCHRRSGMGTFEGNQLVPPITGQFLYRPRAGALAEMDAAHTRGPDLAHAAGRTRTRDPYTDETLLKAIREGLVPGESPLVGLMPRYSLSDADARLLIDYLKQLSRQWSPGVARDSIQFATVVAPGVDKARKKAMLDVLQAFVEVRNSAARLERLRDQTSPASAHKTYRAWHLQVWELAGAPETWEAQLATRYRRQPVFALVSGVSQGTWVPVQRFCEKQGLPCWFPTVDLPVTDSADYYTTYFSGGVVLEAEVLAHRLLEEKRASRVIQIRGGDEAAAGAAQALARALQGGSIRVEERVLPRVEPETVRASLADAGPSDAVVLWLRGRDLAHLGTVVVPTAPVYFSAILAGGELAPLPPAWKASARLIYPFELPDRRRSTSTRFRAWLQTRHLTLVDERLQADAYLAAHLMSEKVEEMLENLYRDYLIDRAEAKLSERLATVTYHRLSLGPGQRFASKGGYIARFASPASSVLVPETGWIVP